MALLSSSACNSKLASLLALNEVLLPNRLKQSAYFQLFMDDNSSVFWSELERNYCKNLVAD
jgi:hypothetical protein